MWSRKLERTVVRGQRHVLRSLLLANQDAKKLESTTARTQLCIPILVAGGGHEHATRWSGRAS
jgi:hypothetical protein